MKDTSSGALGILGMAGAVILFLVLRKFFPTLSTILLVVFGIILLLIILLVTIL